MKNLPKLMEFTGFLGACNEFEPQVLVHIIRCSGQDLSRYPLVSVPSVIPRKILQRKPQMENSGTPLDDSKCIFICSIKNSEDVNRSLVHDVTTFFLFSLGIFPRFQPGAKSSWCLVGWSLPRDFPIGISHGWTEVLTTTSLAYGLRLQQEMSMKLGRKTTKHDIKRLSKDKKKIEKSTQRLLNMGT